VGADKNSELNLKQAAAALEVHYMTAYRYVRTGRLPAQRAGNGWVIRPDDLASFAGHRTGDGPGPGQRREVTDWRGRLRSTLVVADETAAWRVLEGALAAGYRPADCYLDLLVGAIDDISGRCALPDAPVAELYLATATAARLVARLGARFRRPGRDRGTVIFGAPLGEHHTLAISVVADLVRMEGFNCLELGANVPPEAFAGAAGAAYRLIAVGISVTTEDNIDAVRQSVKAVHSASSSVPVVLGGQAASGPSFAEAVGAQAWASDGLGAVQVITEIARANRALRLAPDGASLQADGPARTA
jgi:excisionase family DNA binding protein